MPLDYKPLHLSLLKGKAKVDDQSGDVAHTQNNRLLHMVQPQLQPDHHYKKKLDKKFLELLGFINYYIFV